MVNVRGKGKEGATTVMSLTCATQSFSTLQCLRLHTEAIDNSTCSSLLHLPPRLTLTSVLLLLTSCHACWIEPNRRSGASKWPFCRRSMCAGAARTSQNITYLQQRPGKMCTQDRQVNRLPYVIVTLVTICSVAQFL